jgi:hypothetical protein
MILKLVHLGKQSRNTGEGFKCGPGVTKNRCFRLASFSSGKF